MKRHSRISNIFAGLLLIFLTQFTLVAQANSDIGGEWRGIFNYNNSSYANRSGLFTLYLNKQDTKISGIVVEPWTFFCPKSSFLIANISGTYNAATKEVSFTKTYDYDGHKVEYSGTLDTSGTSASGKWVIGKSNKNSTGTWTILKE